MPLDLEAKADDSIQLAEDLEQEGNATVENAWLVDGAGTSFIRKFTVAMELARDSGVDVTHETFDALFADYQAMSDIDRYAAGACLSGVFPTFNWFTRNEYDSFCNPP